MERNRNLEGRAETSLEARRTVRKPGHVPRREQLGVRGSDVPEQELRAPERAQAGAGRGPRSAALGWEGTIHLPSRRHLRLTPTNLQ